MEKEKLVRTVQLAQCGSSSALNELFNAFYNDVYYFALKNVKDEDLACDITQETFVEIIDTLGKLKEPAAFITWMKQITYHQCTRYFKKKKEVLVDENEDGNTVFDTMVEERAECIPDEAMDQEDFRTTIMGMIDQLPDEQRAATMMYYFDEMSVKEIAQAQGVGENTVKGRLSYSRKAIKKSVEDYEKKNNVKLHSLGILPLLLWMYQGYSKNMSATAAKGVAKGISAASGTTITVTESAAFATATTTTAMASAGLGAKIASLPGFVKAISVAVAASVVIAPVAIAINGNNNPKKQSDTSIQSKPTFAVQTQPIAPPGEDESVTLPPENENITPPNDKEETGYTYYVPAGCTYTTASGEKFAAGELVTATCTTGDTFTDGEYNYRYDSAQTVWQDAWVQRDSWSATVIDRSKTTYMPVQVFINGKTLKVMDRTYEKCTALKTAPTIPEGVEELIHTFSECSALENAPVLPQSLKRMEYTFNHCTALKIAPAIPNGVTCMDNTFYWCTSLTAAPTIPDSVTSMNSTFFGCRSLVTASAFSPNVVNISSVYSGTAITLAPAIPESVLYANLAFSGTKITTAPVIPANVICACNIFQACWQLTGEVTIHAQLSSKHIGSSGMQCLTNGFDLFPGCTQPIVISGNSSQLEEIAAEYDNVTVKRNF